MPSQPEKGVKTTKDAATLNMVMEHCWQNSRLRRISENGKNLAGGVSEPPGSIQIPGKRNYLDDAGTDREQVNFITCMDSLCSTKANLRLYHISKITTITAFKNCTLKQIEL